MADGLEKGDFDGFGYPILNCPPVVVLSQGKFIYGSITYILPSGMMVVLASWRRIKGTIIKAHKPIKYLKEWERVSPPRKFLAARGRVIDIAPPE